MNPTTPNAATLDQTQLASTLLLVEIIELKWLLAGHGIRLHVEHLQADQEYARWVLAQAMAMPNPALRAAAERLRCGLGLAAC
ncbi:MAG TPA: hypothetical protein VEZ89_02840 [Rubrivivax sp.]|nr:hypothetical protein [Rubrivivax sp.]